MIWDSETIATLRSLWEQGHSTAEIGRRMVLSKNAIVGKAHRLGLPSRPSPIHRNGQPKVYVPVARPQFVLPPLASTQAAGIASMTGHGYKLAVIAQAMGLDVRVVRAVVPGKPLPVTLVPPMPSPEPRRQASKRDCCWPIGEPGTKTFRFCDSVSVVGKPYCDEHARLAYVKVRREVEA